MFATETRTGKKVKKVLSMVLILCLVMSTFPLGVFADSEPGFFDGMSNGEVRGQKVITDNGDGTYDITFNALGKKFYTTETTNTTPLIDFLFVIDRSGSMANDSKAANSKTAYNNIMDLIFNTPEKRVANRVSVITYADNVNTATSWTTSSTTLQAAKDLYKTNSSGSTNTQGAIREADRKLDEAMPAGRENAIQVVILISDGLPTRYYDGLTSTVKEGDGQSTTPEYVYNTHMQAVNLKANHPDVRFYTIGFGLTPSTAMIATLMPNESIFTGSYYNGYTGYMGTRTAQNTSNTAPADNSALWSEWTWTPVSALGAVPADSNTYNNSWGTRTHVQTRYRVAQDINSARPTVAPLYTWPTDGSYKYWEDDSSIDSNTSAAFLQQLLENIVNNINSYHNPIATKTVSGNTVADFSITDYIGAGFEIVDNAATLASKNLTATDAGNGETKVVWNPTNVAAAPADGESGTIPAPTTVTFTIRFTATEPGTYYTNRLNTTSNIAVFNQTTNNPFTTQKNPLPLPPTEEVTITPNLNLTLVKTMLGSGTYGPGSAIPYQIVITNTGNVPATLSNAADLFSGTPTGAYINALKINGSDSTDISALNGTVLARGASITIAYNLVLPAASTALVGSYTINNTASVTGTYNNLTKNVSDSATANALYQTIDVPVVYTPGIEVTKQANVETIVAGGTINYTIRVENTGEASRTTDGYDASQLTVNFAAGWFADTLVDAGRAGTINYSLNGGAATTTAPTSLAVGQFVLITYSVATTVADIGTLDNEVTINGTAGNGGTVTDKADETVSVTGTPNYSITKTITSPANTNAVIPGTSVSYSIVVTNTGNIPLTNILVTDDMVGNNGDFVNGQYTIADLAVGASRTFTYTLTAAGTHGQVVTNTATISHADLDPLTDTASYTVFVPAPGISITKSVDKTTAYAGQTITWTITYKNTGNVALTGVVLTDSRLGYTNNIGTLAVGAEVSFTLTETVDSAFAVDSVQTNTASIVGYYGTDDYTGSDSASYTVIKTPQISVEKSVNVSSVLLGTKVDYTIVVTNNGGVDVTDVTVTDATLGVTFTSAEYPGLASMAPGAVVTITVSDVEITAANVSGADIFRNTVTVSGTADGSTVTDSDSEDVAIVTPGVTLEKEAGETAVFNGTAVDFTFTLTNTGNVPVTATLVDDKLPADTVLYLEDGTEVGTAASNTFVIPANSAVVLKAYAVTIEFANHADYVNEASANYTYDLTGTGDGSGTSNEDTATITELYIDVEIEKTGDKSLALPGETVNYTITVTNNGTAPAYLFSVADAVLGIANFINNADGYVLLAANGGSVTFTVTEGATYTIPALTAAGTTITNTAVATFSATEDGTTDTAQDSWVVEVDRTAEDFTITKTVDKTTGAIPGDVLNYAITLYNPNNYAITVAVSDPMLNISATDHTIAAFGTLVLQNADAADTTYSYTVTIADATAGTVVNTAYAQLGSANPKEATATTTVLKPSISLTEKAVDPTTHAAISTVIPSQSGAAVGFEYTVTNNGAVALTNVTLYYTTLEKDTFTGDIFESVKTINVGNLAIGETKVVYSTHQLSAYAGWLTGDKINDYSGVKGSYGNGTVTDTANASVTVNVDSLYSVPTLKKEAAKFIDANTDVNDYTFADSVDINDRDSVIFRFTIDNTAGEYNKAWTIASITDVMARYISGLAFDEESINYFFYDNGNVVTGNETILAGGTMVFYAVVTNVRNYNDEAITKTNTMTITLRDSNAILEDSADVNIGAYSKGVDIDKVVKEFTGTVNEQNVLAAIANDTGYQKSISFNSLGRRAFFKITLSSSVDSGFMVTLSDVFDGTDVAALYDESGNVINLDYTFYLSYNEPVTFYYVTVALNGTKTYTNVASFEAIEGQDGDIGVIEDGPIVTPQVFAGSSSASVTVTSYTEPIDYQIRVTVEYRNVNNGNTLAPSAGRNFSSQNYNVPYDVTNLTNLAISGYNLVSVEGQPSGTSANNVTVVVYYDEVRQPNDYAINVTVEYRNVNDNSPLAQSVTRPFSGQSASVSYNVADLLGLTINGYYIVSVDGQAIGSSTGNVTVVVYYDEETDIEEENPPLIDIEEEDTPLIDVPVTGDLATVYTWLVVAMSAMLLMALVIGVRRRANQG